MAAPLQHSWETATYDPREGHDEVHAFRLYLDSVFPDGYNAKQHGEGLKKQEIEDWKELANIPDALAQLHRFSHRNQTQFRGKILPDGSNIDAMITLDNGLIVRNGSRHMSETHKFYKAWLELLHYNGLLQLQMRPSPGVTLTIDDSHITSELEVVAVRQTYTLLESHYDNTPLYQLWDIPLAAVHTWIRDWRKVVLDILAKMWAASRWARVNNQNELLAIQQAYSTITPITKVLVQCLAKEIDFETRLQRFHVEDELYWKRVSLLVPEDLARLGQGIHRRLESVYWARVERSVNVIQRNVRSIYDYRLVRDWAHRRPWLKLYMVFDTSANKQLHEAITHIQGWFNEDTDRRNWDLFDVQPVIKGSMPGDNTTCSICMSDFVDSELMMQTHCRHGFHAQCLMEFWDSEYKYDYSCPLCRQSPGRLRDRAEVVGSKQDWGDAGEQAAQSEQLEEAEDLLEDGFELEELPEEMRVAVERERESARFKRVVQDMKRSGLGLTRESSGHSSSS
ncbi:MAG: hypothetical protein FRX48_02941 [Lasallia pustulata]|uniref:RING-type domain-containing protein n=1 Tax=Lasallia pustulata TaxID=136370 RepID=A0A5M8PW74_9LECA|nr:MAG: hypothetical protein FRX48_02941 [Lasallia pustulata]